MKKVSLKKIPIKKNINLGLLLTTILVLALCVVIGLILSAARFSRNPGPTYASATLELTFNGAAAGTSPNGVEFDLRVLESDEVLSAGLKAASLEGAYTPEQIRPCLTVRGVYPDSMAQQVLHYESLLDFSSSRELSVGNYHPTTFHVTLTNDFDESIARNQLTALLNGIMEACRRYFTRVYSYGLDPDSGVFDLDKYDYPQQLDIIESRFNAVSGYARTLYKKDPAFLFRGSSFNDVDVRLSMLLESSLTRLTASLTLNGLSKNTERLLTQYQFQVHDLSIRRDMLNQELDKLDEMITSYEKHEIIYLPTSEALTKIDGNSSATYDTLVNKRKSISDSITELNTRITNYNLRIADLLNSTGALPPNAAVPNPAEDGTADAEGNEAPAAGHTPTAKEIEEAERKREAQRAALEEDIRTLVAEGEAVISDFGEMLQSYNEQQINESTFVISEASYRRPRLMSKSFIMQAVETTGPIVALGFMVCVILIIIRKKKEESGE